MHMSIVQVLPKPNRDKQTACAVTEFITRWPCVKAIKCTVKECNMLYKLTSCGVPRTTQFSLFSQFSTMFNSKIARSCPFQDWCMEARHHCLARVRCVLICDHFFLLQVLTTMKSENKRRMSSAFAKALRTKLKYLTDFSRQTTTTPSTHIMNFTRGIRSCFA